MKGEGMKIKSTLRSTVLFAFAAFIATASYAQTVPADLQAAIAKIDTMTQQELAKDNIGSVTIGVVSGGTLVWTKSYGLADMEKKIPASRESVYRIGSITKQFTALMFLQLIQDKKVRLSDPVEKFFPEVNRVQGRIAGAPAITLVQLATMTSGLSREPEDLPTYLKGPVSDWEKVMISALPKVKYDFEPDTRYQYSNIGYAILGAALSRAAGQPFTQFVQQRIFTPLEMTTSAFEPNARIRANLTKGYAVNQGGRVDAETPAREHEGRGYKVPNGAMYTTVGDLAKFVAFELGEGPASVLPKEVWQENLTRVNSSNGSLSSGYGVGFQISRRGEMIAVGHGGSVAGYNAAAQFDPASRTGVIVLRNVGGGAFNVGNLCIRALTELHAARPRAASSSGR
jgi:CubicO group peptidase (beta-lactamase class C family)